MKQQKQQPAATGAGAKKKTLEFLNWVCTFGFSAKEEKAAETRRQASRTTSSGGTWLR